MKYETIKMNIRLDSHGKVSEVSSVRLEGAPPPRPLEAMSFSSQAPLQSNFLMMKAWKGFDTF